MHFNTYICIICDSKGLQFADSVQDLLNRLNLLLCSSITAYVPTPSLKQTDSYWTDPLDFVMNCDNYTWESLWTVNF